MQRARERISSTPGLGLGFAQYATRAGADHRGSPPTPLVLDHVLSERLGRRVWLKAESLQRTGLFKARGALNWLGTASDEELSSGLGAVSAGNHGLGLAWVISSRVASGFSSTNWRIRRFSASLIFLGRPPFEMDASPDWKAYIVSALLFCKHPLSAYTRGKFAPRNLLPSLSFSTSFAPFRPKSRYVRLS